MKKLLLLQILAFTFMFALIISCEPEPIKPTCEINQTGSVKIINHTDYQIQVDVFDGTYHGERYVSSGASTTYNNIDAGTIQIWENDAYTDWGYWERYVDACDTYELTLTSKKSEITNEQSVEVTLGSKTTKNK